MDARLSAWSLQVGPLPTPNGTDVSEALKPDKVGPIGEFLRDFGIPHAAALGAAITFAIALIVLSILGRATVVPFVSQLLKQRELDTHERKTLLRMTKVFMVFIALAIAFSIAGYGNLLTSLATVAAAATLAIGFALQETIANFVAGIFIYTDRPFSIGDWIEWYGESGSYVGVVEDISFRVTRILTFDNELLTVPNSVLTTEVIKNVTSNDELRIQFTFDIGYEDDIQEATDIMIEEAENHTDILDDPAPTVRMSTDSALADSSVGLTSRIWIDEPKRTDYLKVRGEYITAVKEHFDATGIDMPNPQVHLSGTVGVENPPRTITFSKHR